jgi:ABC-type dipeptide/oligopeptide/nickel transport system permease subunit
LYPAGIAIIATVLAFNFIGEGIEESMGIRG